MKNIPQKIYLQIGEGCPDDVCFDELSDVTWWDEKIFDNDIEYVHGGAWHDAESDDLPPYDKEVIVLRRDGDFRMICFAHRPNPNGYDCKSVLTGEIYHYNAETFGKGWNIEHVKWWLNVELPKDIELTKMEEEEE